METMMKLTDIKSAITLFQKATINQTEATEEGDFKTGNKNYSLITKAATYLKEHNAISELRPLLLNSSVGVRLWAASYLLPVFENESLLNLKKIVESSGIHSFTAENTIVEWKKGNLKF